MKKATKKSKNSIKYTGTVKVSVQKDNKILSTKTYHNNGALPLFKFLCYCLAGRYETIKNNRPIRIKLFHNNAATPAGADPTYNASEALSAFISVDQIPEVIPVRDELENFKIINYKTVLHFLIPYSFIVNGSRDINQILLYSTQASDSEYSAYYYFTNEDGTAWEGININVANPDAYSLIVEWELQFN